MEKKGKNLHHAYIVLGEIQASREKVQKIYHDTTDSQWIQYQYEKLGVDEVRELRNFLTQKKSRTFFVVSAERFPVEAQNAFLKILEEPIENIHIFILLPPHIFILETVLSRVIVLTVDISVEKESIIPTRQFLLDSVAQRLNTIEVLIKKRDKDETLQSYEVHQFIDKIESSLYVLFSKKRNTHFVEIFAIIQNARKWAGQTGFPLKNILEYIAMTLPEFGKK